MKAETAGAWICALVAGLVYLNTLPANFAFDDNFAVVYNGDVTNDANPLLGLLRNDFWGQRISSNQSHKSYRPLTVLSFRLIRKTWSRFPPHWRDAVTAARHRALPPLPLEEDEGTRRGVDPLLFHTANLVAHAGVSALVLRFAYFLLLRRWQPVPLVVAVRTKRSAGRVGKDQQEIVQQQQDKEGPGRHGHNGQHAANERQGASDTSAAPPIAEHGLHQRSEAAQISGLRRRAGRKAATNDDDGDPVGGPAAPAHQQQSPRHPPTPSPEPSPPAPHPWSGLLILNPVTQLHAPAWFCGLAFALHPVHTEAVAGVVGHAELLCALLSVPAVWGYLAAAEWAAQRRAAGRWTAGAAAAHWAGLAGAMALALLAALSKEIGITVLGAMIAGDVLLVPLVVEEQEGEGEVAGGSSTEAEDRTVAAAREGASDEAEGARGRGQGRAARRRTRVSRLGRLLWVLWREPKWLRLLLAAAAGVGYVRLRSWVAVDQLVRIYRKVENPIPFSSSFLERTLTTGHLHARYAGLLLWPHPLSADWSFNCIPMLSSPTDPHNCLTAVLYGYLALTVVAARPWGVLVAWWRAAVRAAGGAQGETGGGGAGLGAGAGDVRLWAARWRLLVVGGLVVGPYFPASNVLFYVGTFIGERLLYFPSMGYCLLLAEAVSTVLVKTEPSIEGGLPVAQAQPQHDGGRGANGSERTACEQQEMGSGRTCARADTGARMRTTGRRLRRAAVYGIMAAVLVSYAVRTWLRNYDWLTEEALFESANRVCPLSAKVQLNMGILQRRRGDQQAALRHFRAARDIEPGYCEPDYWIGVASVNAGNVTAGLIELESALSCKYVAAEALKALNAVYKALHAANPRDPVAVMRWGMVLLRPEVGQPGEGCDALEQAALLYARAPMEAAAAAAAAVAERGGRLGPALQQQLVQQQQQMQRHAVASVDNALGWCLQALERQGRQGEEGQQADGGGSAARVVAREVFGVGTERDMLHVPPSELLLPCLKARAALYRALSQAPSPADPHVLAATYTYLSHVRAAPHCRRSAVGLAPGRRHEAVTASPHMQLVHTVQSAHPEDPWLQAEWGRTLREAGRRQEAALHLAVSAMLLQQHLAQLQQQGPPQGSGSTKHVGRLDSYWEPLDASGALLGLAEGLEEAAKLGAPNACDAWVQAAEARRLLAAQAVGRGDAAVYGMHVAAVAAAAAEMRRAVPPCSAEQLAALGVVGGQGYSQS